MFVKYPFLKKWSFANKGEFHREGSTVDVLKLCIANLAYEVFSIFYTTYNRTSLVRTRLIRTPDKEYKSRRSLGVRINEVLYYLQVKSGSC